MGEKIKKTISRQQQLHTLWNEAENKDIADKWQLIGFAASRTILQEMLKKVLQEWNGIKTDEKVRKKTQTGNSKYVGK